MATFAPISYTYVPTALRSKRATARHIPAPKQFNILDKLQQIKPRSTSISTARPAAPGRADDIKGDKLGTREIDTFNDCDDDCDLPSIEQLLYTTLRKEGFAIEDQRSNNTTFGVRDATAEERSGSHDNNNKSAPGDNSGGDSDDDGRSSEDKDECSIRS
ncbi:hypothetical protein BKA65DRAFT_506698 [Rhexocercosporidium sp. MPI-PUGE-AT-0058]|nr:hypothetical protein BKA65DRAFT_506698 [Rhexocercosporidium sp. MPI-PUGE-AT-0058]